MNLIAIGNRIKQSRKKQNYTQESLAEKLEVSPHYIYEIERGSKAMSMETLINLCSVMELSADYILFGIQKQNAGSVYEKLDQLSDERRLRAEQALELLLPFLR